MIDLAGALRAETARAVVGLRRLTEAEAARSRGQGKWVKKEILGHLIDSAANNHQRFVWAQFSDPFAWPEYEQERWVQIHRYRDRPWLELVVLWAALNEHVAAVVEATPAGKLQTRCRIGDLEAVSLEGLMQGYLQHMRHHLDQLARECQAS
jgi:DinB superfamily